MHRTYARRPSLLVLALGVAWTAATTVYYAASPSGGIKLIRLVPRAAEQGAILAALALLGILLVRANRPAAGLLLPATLVLLPLSDHGSRVDGLLLPTRTDVPVHARWPYGEGVLQLVIVLVPVVLALRGRPATGDRPMVPRPPVALAGVALVAALGYLLAQQTALGTQWSATGRGLTVAVVVFSSGLLATGSRRSATAAMCGAGTLLVLHVVSVCALGSAVPWLDLVGYSAAMAAGPAAVVLAPRASSALVGALRRGPALPSA